jgi:hypothetical protein
MTGLAARQTTEHDRDTSASRNDGLRAGLVGATAVWAWLLVDDLISRAPLSAARVLGRGLLGVDRFGVEAPAWLAVVAFTLAHCALWLGVGALAMRVARRAARTPSVVLAAMIALVLVQFLLVGIAAILAQGRLGALAWRDVAVGNAIGWAALGWYVARRYRALRDGFAHAAAGRDA